MRFASENEHGTLLCEPLASVVGTIRYRSVPNAGSVPRGAESAIDCRKCRTRIKMQPSGQARRERLVYTRLQSVVKVARASRVNTSLKRERGREVGWGASPTFCVAISSKR